MEPADGAEVHVVLPGAGKQKTKAAATLQESPAHHAPDHHEHAMLQADAAAPSDEPACSSKALWVLFALGWIISPCWWLH